MKIFEVAIIYKGQDNYIVRAETVEEARKKASEAWEKGQEPVELGNEWEDIDEIIVVKELGLDNN